ncbi:MAG: 50S ribosomal protein L11 methyltransferase, partial [Bacillota bacterium]
TRPGGKIIAAGISREKWPQLQEIMQQRGLDLEKVCQEEDWVAVLVRRS